jgi:hypothetical protein
MIDDTSVYPKQYHNEREYIRNNIITKESTKILYYMTESLNVKQPINILN